MGVKRTLKSAVRFGWRAVSSGMQPISYSRHRFPPETQLRPDARTVSLGHREAPVYVPLGGHRGTT